MRLPKALIINKDITKFWDFGMTIDDELLVELFKPDRYGKISKGAPIVNIVGTQKIS